jgi:hypothetical protein
MSSEPFSTANILLNVLSAFFGASITLWLTKWKENREAKTRFKNSLVCLAHELHINFQDVGNPKNPFQTKALEKLVYDEPLIHTNPQLFETAQKCLYTALVLSSSAQSKLKPADGQFLMKTLAEFLSTSYNIRVHDHEQTYSTHLQTTLVQGEMLHQR